MDARRIPLDVQQAAAAGGGRGVDNTRIAPPTTDVRPGLVVPDLIVPRRPELSVERFASVPQTANLGRGDVRLDIRTTMGPFHTYPEYKTEYPGAVTRGLGSLYTEYNQAFAPLVDANREWDTDYQHIMFGPGGTPVNLFVQIDMQGLPAGYLDQAAQSGDRAVGDSLRGSIFEIENSVAMYGLLSDLFPRDGQPSQFKEGLRAGLDVMRERTGKPIALLAVTEDKARAMRESEFGKRDGEPLTDAEVRDISGFDAFFGPEEFAEMVRKNGGESPYLLYARTSEPVAKLRKPGLEVDNPLLSDPDMRRVIKANAITLNIDNPDWAPGDPRRINDTKAYLAPMGMAMVVASPDELFVIEPGAKRGEQPIATISEELAEYLISQGKDPADVYAGQVGVRAKPLQGTYGCYGHVSGSIRDKDFRTQTRKGIKDRGLYVIQPEMVTPEIADAESGAGYKYIDRNFMSAADDPANPRFMGGFRSLMPVDTVEAKANRIHGNGETRWAEVKPAAA